MSRLNKSRNIIHSTQQCKKVCCVYHDVTQTVNGPKRETICVQLYCVLSAGCYRNMKQAWNSSVPYRIEGILHDLLCVQYYVVFRGCYLCLKESWCVKINLERMIQRERDPSSERVEIKNKTENFIPCLFQRFELFRYFEEQYFEFVF